MDWLLPAVAFLVGLLTRIVDLKEDEGLRLSGSASIALGAAYGFLVGFVFNAWPQTAPLLGVFIGLIIAKKIDAPGHWASLPGLAAAFLFIGVPSFRPLPVALFMAACLADEAGDWLQEKRRMPKPLARLLYLRPFVEVSAFAYSWLTGAWELWATILTFDMAFVLFHQVWKSRTRGRPQTRKRPASRILAAAMIAVAALLAIAAIVTQPQAVPEDKRCSQDSDCACGVHAVTGECFYGNAAFVDTERQCPDFCTGIAANLAIRCISSECRHVRVR